MTKLDSISTAWLPLAAALVACGSAPAVNARDAADANDTGKAISARDAGERDVLQQLPRLPIGTPARIGGLDVTASAPYAAASGRICRPLQIGRASGHAASQRLACTNGGAWFFVPDVFMSDNVAE